jgi:hypothetical protein
MHYENCARKRRSLSDHLVPRAGATHGRRNATYFLRIPPRIPRGTIIADMLPADIEARLLE